MDILQWVKRQTSKIADNAKDYKFYVKHEPSFIDSSTTLVLTTYSNRDQMATIPCIYKWSRIKNGLVNQVQEFKGSSFICEPADIGSIIQAKITSTDPQHPGTAIIKFGPVKFDVLLKKQIEHSLASKSATFNVNLLKNKNAKQCQIRITDDTMKIAHSHSNIQYTFDYNLNEPRIQASAKEPAKVNISFHEKYQDQVKKFINQIFSYEDMASSLHSPNEHRVELQFANRAAKDKFLYVIKAYITRRAMKNAAVMHKIEDFDFNAQENFNTMLEIESLRADLVKLARLNDKYLADKRMYYEEARKLQKEIEQIIVTYTRIAQGKCNNSVDLDQSVMELREKKDQVMQRKIQNLLQENEALRDRIQFLSQGNTNKSPTPGLIRSQNVSDHPLAVSRGFGKKLQVQEASCNHFNQILQKLNQSEVKQPSPFEDQIKSLAQEKSYLAKKLNQSVMKVAKLQQKLKKAQLNNTSINMQMVNHSQMSFDDRVNFSAINFGQGGKNIHFDMEELKKFNIKLLAENQRLKSDISMVSLRDGDRNSGKKAEKKSEIQEKDYSEQASVKSSVRSELNPQAPSSGAALKNRIRQLQEENEKLKNQIRVLVSQRDVIYKEKTAIQTKYKKKLSDMMNQNSMYRRNQDALNRSQNLSMEMDQYNQEQCNLLKEQNEILSKENEKLSKICEKYISEAKQVPKLREQINALRNARQNAKQINLTHFRDNDEILLQSKL